jgi:tripartite-type tricarboxylate transporter receptor subunit TctC
MRLSEANSKRSRMITRRATLAGLAALAGPLRARAQTPPRRTITIVVPYPPGGAVDLVARLLAQESDLGQVVVDNRAGASGVVGTLAVARAEPDGQTLVLGTNQTHATNQSLIKNCPYDATRDFAPVAGLALIPHVLVVRKDLPVLTVDDFIALAKAKPGGFSYGSTGNGSGSHLAGELFKTKAGVDLLHVPFKGVAPMTTELLAGRVDLSIAPLPGLISQQIEAGNLHALATASTRRAPKLPSVPTMAQAGLPGVEADAWFALFAPARTPPAMIDRLYQAFTTALRKDAVRSNLTGQGLVIAIRTPAEMTAMLPGEVEKWAAVIKTANVVLD